jgi:hypothetical protein
MEKEETDVWELSLPAGFLTGSPFLTAIRNAVIHGPKNDETGRD